jgi:type I restriction enzyme M protein
VTDVATSVLIQLLWKAADMLRSPEVTRGSIDPSRSRRCLFGLLFLKWLSDRFEEEAEDLIARGIEEEIARTDPDEHAFMVPEQARWSAIQGARHPGDALNKACAVLADANPALTFLGEIDFNDGRAFGDGRLGTNLLQDLLKLVSAWSLQSSSHEPPDQRDVDFDLLLESFARDEGKQGAASRTPRQVAELIVRLLDPQPGMRICDPTCGTGGMLVRCAAHVARRQGQRLGVDPVDLTVHGQEIDHQAWTLCKMNLTLAGLSDARIEHGDTLREPKLTRRRGLMVYDRILANPTFGVSSWRSEHEADDPFARFRHGTPPRQRADYAFVQHVLATLEPTGIAGVVVSHGALFRGGAEGVIRRSIIEDDVIEAIIGLPANLFYGTAIPTAILLLNRNKPEVRRSRILFVDASADFQAAITNELRPADVERIVSAVRSFVDEQGFCRVVPLAEIAQNDHILTVRRYVDTREQEAPMDLGGALETLRELEATRDAAAARMDELLRELGHDT